MSIRHLTVSVCLATAAALHAQNPHAGTYRGGYKFYDGTTATGVPYSSAPVEFTIEEDGTLSNVANGSGSLLGAMTGTVTTGGAATYSLSGTNLVSGTVAGGVFTATQVNPPPLPSHPSTTQVLTANRIYGVVPRWQVSPDSSLLPPAQPYGISLAASPSTFCALISTSTGAGWFTLTSSNGVNWTKTPLDTGFGSSFSAGVGDVAWVNGKFLFSFAASGTLRIFASSDGVTWSHADTSLINGTIQGWVYLNGEYAGLSTRFSSDPVRVITSADTSSWTVHPIATGATENAKHIAASGSRWLISMNRGAGYYGSDFTSAPATITYPDSASFGPTPLLWQSGLFVGIGDTSAQVSSDGLAWSPALPGPPITGDNVNYYHPFRTGTAAGGAFYGLSNINSGTVLRSTDGHHWTRLARLTTGPLLWGYHMAVNSTAAVATAFVNGSDLYSLMSVPIDTGAGLPSVFPPAITIEPKDQSVTAGTIFSLATAWSGNGLRNTYQWYKDGQLIPGKTSNTLFFTSPVPGDSGTYYLIATNAAGTTNSRTATVAITPPPKPVLSSYPLSQNVIEGNAGSPFALSVTATGSSLTYQWRLNGVNLSGKTAATLSLDPIAANSGTYDCVVTNAGGSVTHAPATITFVPIAGLMATAGPAFRTVAPGSTAFAQASVTGPGALTFQWYKDGQPLTNGGGYSGVTTASLSINPAAEGTFRCEVTSGAASLMGPPTTITLVTPPTNNLLGKTLTKIADKTTIRPDAVTALGSINSVRFREDTVLLTASASAASRFLYRWKNNVLTAIATDSITAPNGQVFSDVGVPPTEPSGDSFCFTGYHTVSTVQTAVLYRWTAGTLTALATQGDAAPGGGTFVTFYNLAGRGSELFFASTVKQPDDSQSMRIFRHNGTALSLLIGPATALPGTAGFIAGVAGAFAFDGSTLLLPLIDFTGGSAVYRSTVAGALTRLYDINTPVPLTGSTMNPIGTADVEGGYIFAGSSLFEAIFNADNTLRSASRVARTVTACDATSSLGYSGRSVVYRKDGVTLPVVDSSQTLGGITPTAVVAEADGTEAAFLATNATATCVLVALDSAATALPVITAQPVSRTVDNGSTVTFTALASGDGVAWQWFKGADPIPGATLNSLTLSGIASADAASYAATATNSLGSATSNAATLTLNSAASHAPVFITQPADQLIAPGKFLSAGFLHDPGASTVTYLWTKNGQPWSTASSLSFNPATAADAGTYQLTISSPYGSVTSRPVVLSLYDPNPATPFRISNTQLSGGNYAFTTPILTSGKTYTLQSSRTLAAGSWTAVQSLSGGGAAQNVSIPYSAAVPSCFYRIIEAP